MILPAPRCTTHMEHRQLGGPYNRILAGHCEVPPANTAGCDAATFGRLLASQFPSARTQPSHLLRPVSQLGTSPLFSRNCSRTDATLSLAFPCRPITSLLDTAARVTIFAARHSSARE